MLLHTLLYPLGAAERTTDAFLHGWHQLQEAGR